MAFLLGFGTAWLAWFVGTRRREDEVTVLWQRRFADLQRERDQAVTGLNRQLEDARQQIPTLEKSLAERSDLIARLENDLNEWRERLPPVQAGVAERDEKIDALREELAAREMRISELQQVGPADAVGQRREEREWDELRAAVQRAEVAQAEAEQAAVGHEQTAREVAEELNAALLSVKAGAKKTLDERDATIEALRAELARAESSSMTGTTRTLRPGVAPDGLIEVRPEHPPADDLKRIRGVGPVLERTLNQLGIYYFKQIACLNADGIDWVTYHLDTFPGRIERDEWVEQAGQLAAHNGRPPV